MEWLFQNKSLRHFFLTVLQADEICSCRIIMHIEIEMLIAGPKRTGNDPSSEQRDHRYFQRTGEFSDSGKIESNFFMSGIGIDRKICERKIRIVIFRNGTGSLYHKRHDLVWTEARQSI